MQKETRYSPVKFSVEALRAAESVFRQLSNPGTEFRFCGSTSIGRDTWTFLSADSFYTSYRRSTSGANMIISSEDHQTELRVIVLSQSVTLVRVDAPNREDIERVFECFDSFEAGSLVEEVAQPLAAQSKIFIGHGRSQQWRDLKDHLHEQHGYDVLAYETGARAGHAVRDILDDMLTQSSFALLVLTAEDETGDRLMRARQNVVHELGLFQGRLGFSRAIALVEERVEDFTNISGIHQIRYNAGNIRETFGDVLATLRREFGG